MVLTISCLMCISILKIVQVKIDPSQIGEVVGQRGKTINALIEKTEAETQQIRLTTILNAAARLDNDTVLQAICELFEFDFDEIKANVEQNPVVDLNSASETLVDVPIDDSGGGVNE